MIITAKQTIIKLVLLTELILFFWIYLFGAKGIQYIIRARKKNYDLTKQINELNNDISNTTKKINLWNSYPFYKEKFAREKLQMARKTDEVYYF